MEALLSLWVYQWPPYRGSACLSFNGRHLAEDQADLFSQREFLALVAKQNFLLKRQSCYSPKQISSSFRRCGLSLANSTNLLIDFQALENGLMLFHSQWVFHRNLRLVQCYSSCLVSAPSPCVLLLYQNLALIWFPPVEPLLPLLISLGEIVLSLLAG